MGTLLMSDVTLLVTDVLKLVAYGGTATQQTVGRIIYSNI